MPAPRILAFSGSARRESFNQRLVTVAAGIAEQAGAEVTLINLGDYPLPLMNQDLERDEGQPESAAKLKALMAAHDGFLISAPEYNSSMTPLLKNALDWASRSTADESGMVAYQDKAAVLLSASPGRLGGMRGLAHLRQVLVTLGVLVQSEQASVSGAFKAFDDDGGLVDEGDLARVSGVTTAFVDLLKKLK